MEPFLAVFAVPRSREPKAPKILPRPERWKQHRIARARLFGDYSRLSRFERVESRAMFRWLRHRAAESFRTIPWDWLDERSWIVLGGTWLHNMKLREIARMEGVNVGIERVRQIRNEAELIIWRRAVEHPRGAETTVDCLNLGANHLP